LPERPVSAAQSHIPTQGPVTASAMSYAAALSAAKKSEEPEADMFEQQALEIGKVVVEEVVVASEPEQPIQAFHEQEKAGGKTEVSASVNPQQQSSGGALR